MDRINKMEEGSDRYDLGSKVIGLAMKVHSALGTGFLESVYENALALELEEAGISFERQARISVQYRGRDVGDFICDFLVEGELIVELKSVLAMGPVHEVQVVNYLAATGKREGLLLNFGSQKLEFKKKFREYHSVNSVHSVKKASAFTMLELLVSMAVLSMLVVLLLSMVDNATTMWRQSENRVDAYREARAALNIIARDLNSIYLSGRETDTNLFVLNDDLGSSEYTKPSQDHLEGQMFLVTALPPAAQGGGEKSDLCTVGYFVGYDQTSLTGGGTASMNLYRYFRGSNDTFEALKASDLGRDVTLQTAATDDDSEVLARNITGFEIQAYTLSEASPPAITTFTQSATTPVPDIIDITLSAISNDVSKRFSTQAEWENKGSPTHEQHVRTFTKRVVLNRPAPAPTPTPTPPAP